MAYAHTFDGVDFLLAVRSMRTWRRRSTRRNKCLVWCVSATLFHPLAGWRVKDERCARCIVYETIIYTHCRRRCRHRRHTQLYVCHIHAARSEPSAFWWRWREGYIVCVCESVRACVRTPSNPSTSTSSQSSNPSRACRRRIGTNKDV